VPACWLYERFGRGGESYGRQMTAVTTLQAPVGVSSTERIHAKISGKGGFPCSFGTCCDLRYFVGAFDERVCYSDPGGTVCDHRSASSLRFAPELRPDRGRWRRRLFRAGFSFAIRILHSVLFLGQVLPRYLVAPRHFPIAIGCRLDRREKLRTL
jgi:hypothetical protein